MTNRLHKISIIQRFGIDTGHRLVDHEGKCKNVHGHRYDFAIHLKAPELDSLGRIMDFSEVKRKIGGWLQDNWDHGMLMHEDDPIARLYKYHGDIRVYTHFKEDRNDGGDTHIEFPNPFKDMKYFILPCNPTAENLSSYLLTVCRQLMRNSRIEVVKVLCKETPNCSAAAKI